MIKRRRTPPRSFIVDAPFGVHNIGRVVPLFERCHTTKAHGLRKMFFLFHCPNEIESINIPFLCTLNTLQPENVVCISRAPVYELRERKRKICGERKSFVVDAE